MGSKAERSVRNLNCRGQSLVPSDRGAIVDLSNGSKGVFVDLLVMYEVPPI